MINQINNQDNFKKLAEEWFLKAKDDELSIRGILSDREGASSTVCFLSQQIAEKFLKGYLVFNGIVFPKIHDLDRLIKICEQVDESFCDIKDQGKELSDFYVATRYPGDFPHFTWKQAEESFVCAEEIKLFILEKIKKDNQ